MKWQTVEEFKKTGYKGKVWIYVNGKVIRSKFKGVQFWLNGEPVDDEVTDVMPISPPPAPPK